jgi:hypothetical protein
MGFSAIYRLDRCLQTEKVLLRELALVRLRLLSRFFHACCLMLCWIYRVHTYYRLTTSSIRQGEAVASFLS